MNKVKAMLPNLLTLGNLLCGCLAIYFFLTRDIVDIGGGFFDIAIDGQLVAIILIFVALILDFLDGFVARLLGVSGDIGKQLDSLADVVSFGVVPGFFMFHLINLSTGGSSLAFVAFVIPLFAAYRLAQFTIDAEQTVNFKGLATPAMTLFVVGLYFIQVDLINNPIFLVFSTLFVSYLMVSSLPLFSLKTKNLSWGNNWFRYILILMSIGLLIWLKLAAFALIIPLYILLSMIARKTFT